MVAPFAGAWIEIAHAQPNRQRARSLPSRERGLKFEDAVAYHGNAAGRSLRGSVD